MRRWSVLVVSSWALLAACSPPPPAAPAAPAAAAPVSCDAAADAAAPKERAALAEWRSAVEKGPLYASVVATPTACHAQLQAGTVTLDYRFGNGASLRAQRTEAIESTEQEARFGQPSGTDPKPLLLRTERAAFGDAGCGLNWQQPETQAGQGATETVYRGSTCNCQARVRRDAAGQVLGVSWRSAC